MIYIVNKQNFLKENLTEECVISFKKLKKAYIFAITKNFINMEKNVPFYDVEDEYGNNFYFNETPQYEFNMFFPNIEWYDYRTLVEFNCLNRYNIKSLKKMIELQKKHIYIDYNNKQDYVETYFSVKKINLIS